MTPVLENIPIDELQCSFHSFSYTTPAFDFKWHFHPEFELTYIVKGNGYRLIGNSYHEFSNDDFVLIGPNLPHTWFGKAHDNENFEAIVIQMPPDFVQKIISFKEANHLKLLFEKSKSGLFFKAHPSDIKKLLFNVVEATGLEKMIALLTVLTKLSIDNTTPISSAIYNFRINEEMENKINRVCIYLQNNFSNHISLKEVADLIYMTESNFCKFFKKSTSITFSNYLNEIRINAVSKLLINSDNNIKNIAYSCGFESISYFNRVFLKKKHLTPKEFRVIHSIK